MLGGGRWVGCLCVGLLFAGSGCESLIKSDRRKQLERVARDWTQTIRASQVVPVYPLTQDLQPGDVFLVQQSVRQQEATFDAKGFLPIDMQVARLGPGGYAAFYSNYVYHGDSYPSDPDPEAVPSRLPGQWRDIDSAASWRKAPRAGFPAYTFEVSASAGLSLAVPVQAVPVGLSLMGASKATGSVTISDAFTYGVDIASLEKQVREDAAVRELLGRVVVPEGETYYVRVINRVFATRNMIVTLSTDSSSAGGLDVGVPKQVGVTGEHRTSLQQVEAVNTALDAMGDSLPGGSLRAVSAQNRSITFNETFDEPIVFGYHGFDMAILDNGDLGSVVPTFLVLTGQIEPEQTRVSARDVTYLEVLERLRADQESNRARVERIMRTAASGDAELLDLFETRLRRPNSSPVAAWASAVTSYQQAGATPEEQSKRVADAQGWMMSAASSN